MSSTRGAAGFAFDFADRDWARLGLAVSARTTQQIARACERVVSVFKDIQ
jgi:hypothetical protein